MLSAGNITLDCATFELRCGDGAIRLGSKEFQMLELLLRQQGRPISTEQFMERIWGYDSEAEINVVWAYISTGGSWRRWAPTCALPPAGGRAICWRRSHDPFTAPKIYSHRHALPAGDAGVLCTAIGVGNRHRDVTKRADRAIRPAL
ncbi:MAG: winged helix-turn-helix domain-containing protein [Oscillospiraceae bacterium]